VHNQLCPDIIWKIDNGIEPGALGHTRTQQLPITAEQVHTPKCCVVCGQPLDETNEQRACTARYEIDVMPPRDGTQGLVVSHVNPSLTPSQKSSRKTDIYKSKKSEWHYKLVN